MVDINLIKNYFPSSLSDNKEFHKHMLKEYIEYRVMDFLSRSEYVNKITFIGGTCLRMALGIERFSEDLDFDCKGLSEDEFKDMTDSILIFLQRSGFEAEIRDKDNSKLSAMRRNIYFPEMLFNLGISNYMDERFLMKIEAQDQGVDYARERRIIRGCGVVFPFSIPTPNVLLSMKISAFLKRAKGRDIYDIMFLSGFAKPDFPFLSARVGISDDKMLKDAIDKKLSEIDLEAKSRDFKHLLLNPESFTGFSPEVLRGL